MRRRTFTAAAAGLLGSAGCLSVPGESPPGTGTAPTNVPGTETPVVRTADGVRATFDVIDSSAPVDDEANATFDGEAVTVSGWVDPSGCNEPVLDSVDYDPSAGRVSLTVGGESRHASDADCGNASYRYESAVTADGSTPAVVSVTHDYESRESRTVTVERG